MDVFLGRRFVLQLRHCHLLLLHFTEGLLVKPCIQSIHIDGFRHQKRFRHRFHVDINFPYTLSTERLGIIRLNKYTLLESILCFLYDLL